MKKITENEYLEAIRIVNEYTEQIKKTTQITLAKSGINMTMDELGGDWDIYFPKMDIRLLNILKWNFPQKKLCDITKKEFLSSRSAGLKSWCLFCDLIGKNPHG